jgi:MoxR-like ATPase
METQMEPTPDTKQWEQLEKQVAEQCGFVEQLLSYLHTTIVGQEALLNRLLIGLFANGHLLLEGLPGLAKTLAAKSLAESINANFKRIQFTPDILPADVLGTSVYDITTNQFSVKYGPVFANFVLADEINRAPEKVQSALLEVMQEYQVTIGNATYPLQLPFMVLATQNPIDQGGTFELPEAQMDRFMMKVNITYPTLEEERLIIRKNNADIAPPKTSFTVQQVLTVQALVKQIHIDPKIEDYILNLVFCTRTPAKYGLAELQPIIKYGASPRGSINLATVARAHAFLNKRAYVIPDDVRSVAPDVLRHRIGLTYTALAESVSADDVIEKILNTIAMP